MIRRITQLLQQLGLFPEVPAALYAEALDEDIERRVRDHQQSVMRLVQSKMNSASSNGRLRESIGRMKASAGGTPG
jgi:hypothetical protein